MNAPEPSPNVLMLEIAARPGDASADVEDHLLAATRDFVPGSRASAPSVLFTHRILKREGGGLAWQIAFEGLDLPASGDPPGEDMAAAIVAEARARLAGVAEVGAAAYVDLLHPPPERGFSRAAGAVSFADEGLPGWEAYALGSGEPEAGARLPADLVDDIRQSRAAVAVEPGLKPHGAGHMYTGASDKDHVAYLRDYLKSRAAAASPADRRKIVAFQALQAREGSTVAINTYDNQIVTWGTGWGGLGWLGKVMERATAHEPLRDALGRAGVRYRGKGSYDVVDLEKATVLTGKQEALEAIRRSLPLLYLLIDVARDPASRDAATEAQLVTFMEGSGNITGAAAVATQALYNFIAHLKHWAPGYVIGCLEWVAPQVGGEPSAERDRRLAVLVGRYFYGKAIKTRWIPTWSQFQIYFTRHLKEDGLDCSGEPFIKASSHPTDDPFAAVPLPAPAPVAKPAPAPAGKSAPAVAVPKPAAAAPAAGVFKNAPLAGAAELEAILSTGKGGLRQGDRGAGVKALQLALSALGVDVPGGADGVFGSGLDRAVKAFQSTHGLSPDGVAGKGTLHAVDAALGAGGGQSS